MKAIFLCQACKIDFSSASNLNKHLNVCDKYDEWYKNYKPPICKECRNCHRKFLKEYFEEHVQTCYLKK